MDLTETASLTDLTERPSSPCVWDAGIHGTLQKRKKKAAKCVIYLGIIDILQVRN